MIKVQFFASIRESIGVDSVDVDITDKTESVAEIINELCREKPEWEDILKDQKVLAAINQEMCSLDSSVVDGDEIAFFPPVTGG